MSFVTAIPGSLATTAAGVSAALAGSAGGHAGALPGVTSVIPPSPTDPTTVVAAAMLEAHGGEYAAISAWYLVNQGMFAANMAGNEAAYAAVEAANALTAL